MTENVIYIPFPRDLYDDIVQFSEGRLDPVDLAGDQVFNLFERNLGDLTDQWFGDNIYEFALRHFPDYAAELLKESQETIKARDPLVWKEITVPHGSKVRMFYDGSYHYAKVENGKIVDKDGAFTPSRWAMKVANNTSRNAWRDIWFKGALEKEWFPATLLRQQAKVIALEKANEMLKELKL